MEKKNDEPSEPGASPDSALQGLTGIRADAPARMLIRTRESGVTQSAWRLGVDSDRGAGWIVRLDGGETLYRGDGVFLGWSQEGLSAAWNALLPSVAEADPDPPQLG